MTFFRQIHLNKSGSGMASKTACGRNVLRTPVSTGWEDFKAQPEERKCAACVASKHAAFLAKQDAKKEAEELAKWIPEESDDWKTRDDALIAKKKAK